MGEAVYQLRCEQPGGSGYTQPDLWRSALAADDEAMRLLTTLPPQALEAVEVRVLCTVRIGGRPCGDAITVARWTRADVVELLVRQMAERYIGEPITTGLYARFRADLVRVLGARLARVVRLHFPGGTLQVQVDGGPATETPL